MSGPADFKTAALAVFFPLAFSGVYYVMLIYAPRQAADPEGNALTWGLRYAGFVVSVVVGISWLRIAGR